MITIDNPYQDIRNRKGIIYISSTIIEHPDEYYQILSLLFSKFIPIEVVHDFHTRSTRCTGYCMDFDRPDMIGLTIPIYNVLVNSVTNDITFELASNAYRIYNTDEVIPDRLFQVDEVIPSELFEMDDEVEDIIEEIDEI